MREFRDRVAVVTGGASGIGRAMVEAFCREGMHVVIGDIEQPALDAALVDLRRLGADVFGVVTDVSKAGDVETLRDRALSKFGAVHVVCNNAGIGIAGGIAETPLDRWRWALDVNLWGVIHGCHVFLPLLKEQREGYVVNTASIAGLSGHAMLGAYVASKFGVVGLSECLHHELAVEHSPVGVSVFCPGLVATDIRRSERTRPNYVAEPDLGPDRAGIERRERNVEMAGAMPANEAAEIVLQGIRSERFYIFTDPDAARQEIETRRTWMLQDLIRG
ncbi:MAG: SDR family NAD(P)-dependent oxidoreductase [Acidimicrobiales bacterium]